MSTESNSEEIPYVEYKQQVAATDPPAVGEEGPVLPQSEYEAAISHPHDEPEKVEAHEQEMPTESHALANADHDEKGAAQIDHGEIEVRDLGWNEDPKKVPNPLVGGLPNEELWTLIRRFNKVGVQMASQFHILIKSSANVSC